MSSRIIYSLLRSCSSRSLSSYSSSPSFTTRLPFLPICTKVQSFKSPASFYINSHVEPASIFSSFVNLRFFNSNPSRGVDNEEKEEVFPVQYETEEEDGESTDGWEEEDEVESKMGDGGDGGGVVLQGVPWGERALSIAHEVLLQFGDDIKLYAFKTYPRGYIYVRLDKLSTKYGCPSMEELESYNQEYKRRIDEAGAKGEIPVDLALEISSPGAERILKIPGELDRFKDMPMRVNYVEDVELLDTEKVGVLVLESVEEELGSCVWKLANCKENRDPLSKGRPLSRKQKDWRLKLPFEMHRKVTLYLEY